MAASRLSGWVLPGLAAVVALPVALLGLAWGDMYVRGHTAWPTDVTVPPPGDATRGAHLLVVAKCGFCHGADYGGGVMMDDPMLGAVRGPNLTPGGAPRTDADIVRALRRGVNAEGHALLAMPTTEHAWLTDAEIADILAALRALPPVERPDVPSRMGPGMAVLGALDVIELYAVEQLAAQQVHASAGPAADAAYGEHLAHVGSCVSCHGPNLAGGPMPGAPPDWPPAANLTPHAEGLAAWTLADFTRAMRLGLRPDGSSIDPKMPWAWTAQMTDEEILALYLYLRAVPPAPTGAR